MEDSYSKSDDFICLVCGSKLRTLRVPAALVKRSRFSVPQSRSPACFAVIGFTSAATKNRFL